MIKEEMVQLNIEEFSRLQDYMIDLDKESEAYKKMKIRYTTLKAILSTLGIDFTILDRIKE